MSGTGGSVSLQVSIQDTLNKTVSDFAASNVAECYAKTKQLFDTAIINSNFHVSGDFQQTQDAKVGFSCIQNSQQSAELMTNLASQMQSDLKQDLEKGIEVGTARVGFSKQKIENIVEKHVKLNNEQKCTAIISNDAVLKIINSKVDIGTCDEKAVSANETACTNLITTAAQLAIQNKDTQANAMLELAKNPCGALKTCAEKTGKFLISQGISFDGKCDQVGTIAANIADDLKTEMKATQTITETSAIGNIFKYIIIGVVVVAVVGAIAGIFTALAKKKQQQPMSPYGAQGSAFEQYGPPQSPYGGVSQSSYAEVPQQSYGGVPQSPYGGVPQQSYGGAYY